MSITGRRLIPLAVTLALLVLTFVVLAPVAAAAEHEPGITELADRGGDLDRTLALAVGAGTVIIVLAVVGVIVSEMFALRRNPIVRSGRRPTRR